MMTNDLMLGGVYILMAMMLVLGSLMSRREPAAKLITMRRRSPTWRMIVPESRSKVSLSEVISSPNLRCIRSAAS